MKKTFSFLRGLLLLAAVSLTAVQAGAQNEALRPQIEEMYKTGLLEKWMKKKDINYNLTDIYVKSMEASGDLEVLKLSKEQKRWRASRIVKLYMQKQMDQDMIDVLTAALPDTLSLEYLVAYKEYNYFPLQESYKKTSGKITALTNDSVILKQFRTVFEPAINEIMTGKPKKAKAIKVLPCPKSFRNAFEAFLGGSPLASQLWKQAIFPLPVQSIENIPSKDYHHRSELKKQYIKNNVPAFWQNIFVENNITEQDLEALTPPTISKEERLSFSYIYPRMVRMSKDLHKEMLRRFSAWYSKWSKDENEDHSLLSYTPSKQDLEADKQAKDNAQDPIFEETQSSPFFPGGEEALLEFLSQNIIYPRSCQEHGIQGRVYASFVVEADGSITDININRSPHPDMSEETIRVLSLMPNWIPGMINGKPVRVKYSVPIMFRL